MAEFLNFKGDYNGLTNEKAAQNLEMYGENSFTETEDKSFKSRHILLNITVVLLFLSGLIEIIFLQSVAMGIACFAIAIAGAVLLAVHCNGCNERISALISAAKMKYRVIREGKLELIPQSQIVPDDVIILQSGEMVPADAHILECFDFTCDESRFTGNKKPVKKNAGVDNNSSAVLKSSCVYAGGRVLSGSAVARVVGTGEDAYRMRINADKAKLPDPDYSHYEKTLAKLRLPLTLCAIAICVLIFIKGLIFSDIPRNIFFDVICATSLFICMIPPYAELFVRMYTAHSAKLCQDKGAAIKNLGILQKLTGLTTLIIDKSAVVAPNMLEVAGIYSKSDSLMTTITVLASDSEDPSLTEQTFILNAALSGADISALKSNELVTKYPYNENDRIGGNLYRIDGKYLLAVKGSVDKIISLCDMEADRLLDIQQRAASLSRRGLEVWASAYIIYDSKKDVPKSLYSAKYTYMGMVSFISATRDMIPLAVQSCKKAGIKLVMTSSDSAETAASMGKKIGLKCSGMITGDAMREANARGTQLDYSHAEIFSNITSEQKLEIIDILRGNGEIVAAVGYTDADYELMQKCDLGITSLQKTTGCIYEASGLVTSEDNFLQIVDIAKEARQLHRNIKKCIAFSLSTMVTLLLIVLFGGIFGTIAITPAFAGILAVWTVPVCAMCYMGCTAEIKMDMSPSAFIGRGKMNKRFLLRSLIDGIAIGLLGIIISVICGGLMTASQTLATLFVTLTFSFASLSLANSSARISLASLLKHGALDKGSVITIIFTAFASAVITYLPFINDAFGFEMPHPVALIAAIITGLIPGVAKEIIKKID